MQIGRGRLRKDQLAVEIPIDFLGAPIDGVFVETGAQIDVCGRAFGVGGFFFGIVGVNGGVERVGLAADHFHHVDFRRP